MNRKYLPILLMMHLAGYLISSCQQKLIDEIIVYENDFSHQNMDLIQSSQGISPFNGIHVLGFFNNGGFNLELDKLPIHNMVKISLDLYIHNYWNGNSQDVEGPDIWKMIVDDKEIIYTTFANTPCASTFCQYQSFPENLIRSFPPKTGALETNLPGLYEQANNPGWTTKYRITRIINHTNKSMLINCFDELRQENVSLPHEDESWSVGKIVVSVLNVN
jgi:hypothetical protein